MRISLLIICFLISAFSFSQVTKGFEVVIADSGKYAFKEQAKKDTPDYSIPYRILTNQLKLQPQNAELHYFLGYTLDRMNAHDGKGMYQLSSNLTIRASEQFETVNRLEPVYKGELFILDPYAKIGSIWGSQAQSYLTRGLTDSATWAFAEGRKRGGFIEPILEFNRQLLNSCDKNAILVTIGDNITIPSWYLQTVENYRTDVTVVDASLIHSSWYPKYLIAARNLSIGLSDAVIDTITYQAWQPKQVTIANPTDISQRFSWELRPTYMDGYILKGDRILLSILQQNFYKRPIYFNNNSDSSYNLFLTPYLVNEGLVNRLTKKVFNYQNDVVTVSKHVYGYNIDKLKKEDIVKSSDAISVLNGFRWAFYINVYWLVTQANYPKAKELIGLMMERFKKDKLPFTSPEAEQYFTDFFKRIVDL